MWGPKPLSWREFTTLWLGLSPEAVTRQVMAEDRKRNPKPMTQTEAARNWKRRRA